VNQDVTRPVSVIDVSQLDANGTSKFGINEHATSHFDNGMKTLDIAVEV